jgi:hypothetical protein
VFVFVCVVALVPMHAQVNCAASQTPYAGKAPLPDRLDATCAEVQHDFSGGFFPLQRTVDGPKTPDFKPNTAAWQRPCDERPC